MFGYEQIFSYVYLCNGVCLKFVWRNTLKFSYGPLNESKMMLLIGGDV